MQHPLVKTLVKIRLDRKTREESGYALIVGKNLISDLSQRHPIKQIFHTENISPPPAEHHTLVTEAILKKITGLTNPEGIAALIPLPKFTTFTNESPLLICDHIQDPGNLGTLIRTALALGFKGIILHRNCVDPFNDKALRAAKGATFDLPISTTIPNDYNLYATSTSGNPVHSTHYNHPLALILGNEAHGITLKLKQKAEAITIPMTNSIESLNVAIAGAIAMHTVTLNSSGGSS